MRITQTSSTTLLKIKELLHKRTEETPLIQELQSIEYEMKEEGVVFMHISSMTGGGELAAFIAQLLNKHAE